MEVNLWFTREEVKDILEYLDYCYDTLYKDALIERKPEIEKIDALRKKFKDNLDNPT